MSKKTGVTKPPKIGRKPGKTEIDGTKGAGGKNQSVHGSRVNEGGKLHAPPRQGPKTSGHLNPGNLKVKGGTKGLKHKG